MNKANVRIVLVETSHPGNIGAVARAMQTMGFSQLVLVSPKHFPHPEAVDRATSASVILEQAQVVNSLNEALHGCSHVFGCSARHRELSVPVQTARQCAIEMAQLVLHTTIAIVFGRERSGLTNEELNQCNTHLCIPTDVEQASLNLAAAVQVVAYECHMAMNNNIDKALPVLSAKEALATADQMEGFYQHLQEMLVKIGFLKLEEPRRLMVRMRLLFNRAALRHRELDILRGIFRAVIKTIG